MILSRLHDFWRTAYRNIIKWPAQSPDLNLIENLWSGVEKRLKDFRFRFRSKWSLWCRATKSVLVLTKFRQNRKRGEVGQRKGCTSKHDYHSLKNQPVSLINEAISFILIDDRSVKLRETRSIILTAGF